MAKKPTNPTVHLTRRERQIMDVVYRLGEAGVGDVRGEMVEPPSYSAVRTMIRLLESKGYLKHRREGVRYVYRATQSREQASKSALRHLLETFFDGSATDAVAAILDIETEQLGEDELRRIETMVRQARNEGK